MFLTHFCGSTYKLKFKLYESDAEFRDGHVIESATRIQLCQWNDWKKSGPLWNDESSINQTTL